MLTLHKITVDLENCLCGSRKMLLICSIKLLNLHLEKLKLAEIASFKNQTSKIIIHIY
jgi:hypothetical protein